MEVDPKSTDLQEMQDDTQPKAGRIRMYTSGCAKNQKRCWNSTLSPPNARSKVGIDSEPSRITLNSPPVSTGSVVTNRIDVIKTDHTKEETFIRLSPGERIATMVAQKFREVTNEATPDIIKP
jgi:hypothetical protein